MDRPDDVIDYYRGVPNPLLHKLVTYIDYLETKEEPPDPLAEKFLEAMYSNGAWEDTSRLARRLAAIARANQ